MTVTLSTAQEPGRRSYARAREGDGEGLRGPVKSEARLGGGKR